MKDISVNGINFHNLEKTWIVAEIGVNHEGDFDTAAKLIKLAAKCGVNAVKFQTFRIEHYISKVQSERYERTKKYQLSYEQFRELAVIASESGVILFSTPFHFDDVDFLDEFVPLFKVSSGDLTYLSLIRYIASKNKPMIISTGLGTKKEIQAVLNTILDLRPDAGIKGELILLHCVTAYPTPVDKANLKRIVWLRETFDLPVGYSDHTLGIKACELAVASGAKVLEKHFTYRKENQAFHDHAISADSEDMSQLVKMVRQAEAYMGCKKTLHGNSDEKMRSHMRRSIGAAVNVPAGKPVQIEWLTYLRPSWGLSPDQIDKVVGKRLIRGVQAGDLIRLEDIED